MKQIIAFILGVIFGLAAVVGALAAVVFVLTPDMVTNQQASDYVGEFGSLSLYGMYNKVMKLYATETAVFKDYVYDEDGYVATDENGDKKTIDCTSETEYVSLGMFCATTGIDFDKIFGGAVKLTKSLYEIPTFEYFNGSDGVQNALSHIKVSTIPDIANMFATTDEEGNKFVNKNAIDKLDKYSVVDLVAQDKGIGVVFGEVLFSDLLPTTFPTTETEDNKLMYTIGQTPIGAAYQALTSGTILSSLKSDGALSNIGALKLATLVPVDQTITNILGDTTVSDVIDDEGNITANNMLNTIKLGSVLGYAYEAATDSWYSIVDGTKQYLDGVIGDLANCTIGQLLDPSMYEDMRIGNLLGLVRPATEDISKYTYTQITDDVVKTSDMHLKKDGDLWYEAKLVCQDTTHTETTHTSDCFGFVWYTVCKEDHDHAANGEKLSGEQYYAVAEGMYAVIADIQIAQLINGEMSGITDKMMDLTIADILPQDLIESNALLKNFQNTTFRQLASGDAIKNVYIGTFLDGYTRTQIDNVGSYVTTVVGGLVLKDGDGNLVRKDTTNGNNAWFVAKHDCLNADKADHVCDEKCYPFVWIDSTGTAAEGMMGKFASFTVTQLTNIDEALQALTIRDVLGDAVPSQFKSIADCKIGNLETAINGIMLGDVLGYTNQQITFDSTKYSPIATDSNVYVNSVDGTIAKKIGDNYYTATLTCKQTHKHADNCYHLVWTNGGATVTDITSKLAEKTIGQLDTLSDMLGEVTLADVITVPDILKNIANTPINQLGDAIDTMYVGDLLSGHYAKQVDAPVGTTITITCDGKTLCYVIDNGSNVAISKDNVVWYQATKYCDDTTTTHTHDYKCYGFVWYTNESCTTQATGVMARIANIPLNQLGNAGDLFTDLTLRDVIDVDPTDKILSKLADYKISEISSQVKTLTMGDVVDIDSSSPKILLTLKDAQISELSNKIFGLTMEDVIYINDDSPKILQALADKNINDLGSAVNDLKLSDVVDTSSSPILGALAETKIIDLGSGLNSLKMGVAMGYTFVEGSCGNSAHGTENHWHDSTGEQVKGIYAKIADKPLSEAGSGIQSIMTDITMGDLVDSGLYTLQPDDQHKLAILSCNKSEHSVGAFNCNLAGYMAYKAVNSGATAKQFFDATHATCTAEQKEECLNKWKNAKLTDFLTTILGAL